MADALGFDHALGVITPSGNLVVERITTRLLQAFPTVSAHFARIGVVGDRDPFPDGYDLEGMLTAARLLSHAKPDVILWNGSKGGSIGIGHDADLKARIEDALYAFGSEIESNTVEVYISRLRKKIGRERVQTVRSVGYSLK